METLKQTPLKTSHRIESIDILRGLVMVIMALDHTREFFHHDALIGNDPLNFKTTWPFLFFTRWITHYCAPVFVFLSGVSVFLYGQRNKTKKQVAFFLATRGLWLMLVEIVIINFLWQFGYSFLFLQVIWAIGISMLILSVLQFLPYRLLLIMGLLIIFCHNLLDGINVQEPEAASILWSIVHRANLYFLNKHFIFLVAYPFLPWLGLMITGYCLGKLYAKNSNATYRKKFLLVAGIVAICLFVLIRWINIYGNLRPWSTQATPLFTFLDFVNTTKYPPSLQYILMTIGPALIVLAFSENVSNWFTKKMMVYGRVPFFYYVLHVFLIHLMAYVFFFASGHGSHEVNFPGVTLPPDAGYPLWVTYLVWLSVVLILYYPCKWYGKYRVSHPEKKLLSYL